MAKPSRVEPFGRFLLLERIATGGSADIFLAHDETAESDLGLVVIKRLHAYRSDQRDFIEALIDEARVLERLSHPNIVRSIEHGQMNNSPYLALEHVWGESLDTLSWLCTERERPFPLIAALHIGAELADALSHAHTRRGPDGKPSPIIHRDVTLGNVMITHRGEVKLLDFGIAMAEQRLSRTQTGRVKGTLHYLAPEQVTGEAATPATDIYQLGVLLYKLLVGREPFPDGSPEQILAAIIRGDAREPTEVVPGFPPSLAKMLKRALRIEPTQRYSSAASLKRVLHSLLGERAGSGQSVIAGTFMNLAGDRHREQRTYVRGLLHGVQVDAKVGKQFHRHSQRGEPENLNVELARLLRKVDDLHHASLDPEGDEAQDLAAAAQRLREEMLAAADERTAESRRRPASKPAAAREPVGPESTSEQLYRDLHEISTQIEHAVQRPPGRPKQPAPRQQAADGPSRERPAKQRSTKKKKKKKKRPRSG